MLKRLLASVIVVGVLAPATAAAQVADQGQLALVRDIAVEADFSFPDDARDSCTAPKSILEAEAELVLRRSGIDVVPHQEHMQRVAAFVESRSPLDEHASAISYLNLTREMEAISGHSLVMTVIGFLQEPVGMCVYSVDLTLLHNGVLPSTRMGSVRSFQMSGVFAADATHTTAKQRELINTMTTSLANAILAARQSSN